MRGFFDIFGKQKKEEEAKKLKIEIKEYIKEKYEKKFQEEKEKLEEKYQGRVDGAKHRKLERENKRLRDELKEKENLKTRLEIGNKRLYDRLKEKEQVLEKNKNLRIRLSEISTEYDKVNSENSRLNKKVSYLEKAYNKAYETLEVISTNPELLSKYNELNKLKEKFGELEKRIKEKMEYLPQKYKNRTISEIEIEEIESDLNKKISIAGRVYKLENELGVNLVIGDTVIIADPDGDGLTAAAIDARAYFSEGKEVKVIYQSRGRWINILPRVYASELNILDYPLYQNEAKILNSLSKSNKYKITFITDKNVDKNLVDSSINLISDFTSSTTEIIFKYLDKDDKIYKRLVEIGKSSDYYTGKSEKTKKLVISPSIKFDPTDYSFLEKLTNELANYGMIKDKELSSECEGRNIIYKTFADKNFRKKDILYEGEYCIVALLPENARAGDSVAWMLVDNYKKNGFVFCPMESIFDIIIRGYEDLGPLFIELGKLKGKEEYHGRASSIKFPKEYWNEVLGIIEKYDKGLFNKSSMA